MPGGVSIANAIIAKVGADLSGFQQGLNKAQGVAKKAGKKVAKAFAVARQVKKRHHAWVSCSMGPSDHLLCWGCGPPLLQR